ncbi:MAG: prepilin-type N-terminal cleavage/methylation domain-containing protein [Gammaproteobacteria bacterium]|nr:prepilin-type N-terminal cleavage/methylation domain-containing protein [Gammaproteobacteria bacterium]
MDNKIERNSMSMHQQMRKQLCSQQKGFTLIEIAIVLVIIGLLLGGVLKGQELINSARVRALNNTADGITAAWFSFQDRYRAFPGDYTLATTNLPGVTAVVGNGNGDGQITTDPERNNVWVHLEAAGYITGGYNNESLSVTADYACSVAQCPDNGFGAGMVISHGALYSGATNAHELISGRGIPVDVLAELDRKIDDGIPLNGSMQLGDEATGWTGGTIRADCLNSTNYQLQTPSDNCAAIFRNF